MIWDDGEIQPSQAVRVSPFDRGFLIGDGAFETLSVAEGTGVRLDRHLARLRDTLEALSVRFPWSDEEIAQGIAALSRAMGLRQGVARLTVSAGEGARGLARAANAEGRAVMSLAPPSPRRESIRLCLEPAIIRPRGNPTSAMKTLASYADARLAFEGARQAGADDAVLRDEQGFVAGATTANVFWIQAGRLITPALTGAVLPGVTRAAVLEAATAAGVPTAEREAEFREIMTADAVFLTNAARGIVTVHSVADGDQARFKPVAHELTDALRQAI